MDRPKVRVLDGFGVPFDPHRYWAHIRAGLLACEQYTTDPRPVEPVWKDAPAGRSKCPPLYEDHEQGKGHYA